MKINKRKFCECGCGQRVNNRFVYQHHTRGKNHPNYTHGNKYAMKQWKQAIYKKDNYTCQKCGKQKLQGHHCHAHHIKSKEQYPELIYSIDNGMTVCIDCHNRLHHLGKIMPPCTEERKRKIKLANSGKVKTPEHCNKISLSLKGNIPWNKGVVGKQIAWNKGLNKESMKKYIKFKKEAIQWRQ